MKQAFVAAVAASVVCFSCSASVFAAADVPPEVRHPDFPHICDSGPMRGCPCTPTEADPNDICSDVPFDIPFFEGGPQCVPFVLSEPKGSALLTFIVDEHVIDYDQPDAPANQAFTVLLELRAPDGRHLLAETYQNLSDPSASPGGLWPAFEGAFEPVERSGLSAFFVDRRTPTA